MQIHIGFLSDAVTLTLCDPVKMYAVIGELEAPSVGLSNELTGGDVAEKAQSRSILKSGCSSPVARLSDGIAVSLTLDVVVIE